MALLPAVDVSYRTVRVWQRNNDVFRHGWGPELAWPVFEPLIVMLGVGLGLGHFVELDSGQDYIQFLTPGVMAAYIMWAAVVEGAWASYNRMAYQKTFDAMIATPVSIDDVITGEIAWAASRGVLSCTFLVIIALALTPFWDLVDSPLVFLAIPTAFLAGFMFGSLTLLATSFVTSVSQLGYFVSLIIIPMFWVGGVFFPPDELSSGMRVFAWFLPLSHVVDLQRAWVTGDLSWGILVDVAWIVVVTAALYLATLRSMRRRLIK
jgi:lipooligosaccharide transport system permease protein